MTWSTGETRNSGLVPGCASGYRKLGLMICENAGDSTKLVSEAQRWTAVAATTDRETCTRMDACSATAPKKWMNLITEQ